jgi:glycosyltransferase involved in cell wall biosynthesis
MTGGTAAANVTERTEVCASVIIPSFQSAATIRACLASVMAQDLGEPYEVFVADSGTDETAEIVRREFPRVRLLESESRMDPASARNWCASQARGAVLAFIDSDCVADTDWLRRLCAVLDAGGYDGVGGSVRPVDGSNAPAWAGYFCEFREFLPSGRAADATYLTINNAAYRAETFRRAGGFPVGYFPQEDQVFYYRHLRDAAARMRFEPSIVVAHNHRNTVAAFLAHQKTIGTANAQVVVALGLRGARIAARPWLARLVLPALATYRFARTAAACWREHRYLMVRQPTIAALCWLGMFGWGIGFARLR